MQELRRLSRRRSSRTDAGVAVVEGPKLVSEAAAAGLDIRVIYYADDQLDRVGPLVDDAYRAEVDVATIPADRFAAAVDVRSHQGVAALVARPALSVRDVTDAVTGPHSIVAVLDGVQDPGNVGAILRSAEAFGIAGALLTEDCADPWGNRAMRSSAGSALRLRHATSNRSAIGQWLDGCDRPVWCCDHGGTPPPFAPPTAPAAAIFGAEGQGPSAELSRHADAVVTVRLAPPVESLNVAVAAGIVLFAATGAGADR